jgi:GntR family transcriptional regulator
MVKKMEISRAKTITEQVILLLQERINTGEYAPNSRIPSESELADELNVSRASVRTALSALASTGLISRKHGNGTYVEGKRPALTSMTFSVWEFKHLINNKGKKCSIKGLEVTRREATDSEITILELGSGEEVVTIRRLFYADEDPIIYSLNIIPASYLKEKINLNELDLAIGLDEFVKVYCDFTITGVNVELKANMGNEEIVNIFQVENSVALLELVEVFFGKNGQPVIFTNNYIRDFSLPIHVLKPW